MIEPISLGTERHDRAKWVDCKNVLFYVFDDISLPVGAT